MNYKSKDITINAIEWDLCSLDRVRDFINDREFILLNNNTEITINNNYCEAITAKETNYLIKDEKGDIHSCSWELFDMLFEGVKE